MSLQGFAMPLVTLLLACSATVALQDAQKDAVPFQGKWKIVSMVVGGQPLRTETFANAIVTVTGDERVLREGNEVKSRAKYKADASKSPKTIDITVSEGPFQGRTLKGVYEFKGDTLTINVAIEGDERPTDYSSNTENKQLLQKFQRIANKDK